MPKAVDEGKILRIKEAAIELIVKNGYGGASISAIAKKAKVAEGYLYRHYSGKLDLVEDLLYTRLNVLIEELEHYIETSESTSEIIELLTERLFEMAKKNSAHIKFIHVLTHDYNFQVQDRQRKKIKSLCSKFIKKGIENREINSNITEEQIYLMTVVYPLEFINLRLKKFFTSKNCTKAEKSQLINFCITALK